MMKEKSIQLELVLEGIKTSRCTARRLGRLCILDGIGRGRIGLIL
jgi:hypothetical protein